MTTRGRTAISPPGQGGFTLIELVAVLLVIAIVSALALSRATSTATANLAREADTLTGHLRYAQARAMNDTVPWRITLTGTGYTLFRNTTPQSLPNETATHSFASGVSLTSGGVTVSFDRWGSPGNTTITITLNNSRTITITRNTGFIP